jgi:hydroxyethylthiazole kinase-like uncharacterized protein yjeF
MDKMDPSEMSKAADINSSYLGIERLVLMENAGKEIARHSEKFDSIAIFAGLGNNGGDGLVAARHLSSMGKRVRVYTPAGKRSTECQRNFEITERLDSIEIELIRDPLDCEKIRGDLDKFDLVIDSLLGTGITGELREPLKSLVDVINSSKARRIAVDCPTPGIKADLTLSFHMAKTADATVVNIGIPIEAETYCGPGDVYIAIPKRGGDEHKGDFGRLLVVGGSKEFSGTPALVGRAALRTGVDLAVILAPIYAARKMQLDPDLIVRPLKSESYLKTEDVDEILKMNFDSVIIGNGLGTEDETRYALKKLIRKIDKPVILDADALKLIKIKQVRKNFILTPHGGEFEKLFGEYGENAEERVKTVEKFAKKTKSVILLKGLTDVISSGEKTRLNLTGNAGMTVGGTGDMLAGIVGALSCRTDGFTAACAGAFLSGLAGDIALKELSYSLTATDCIERIPKAIKFCREFE